MYYSCLAFPPRMATFIHFIAASYNTAAAAGQPNYEKTTEAHRGHYLKCPDSNLKAGIQKRKTCPIVKVFFLQAFDFLSFVLESSLLWFGVRQKCYQSLREFKECL